MVPGSLPNRACPAACGSREWCSANRHCSGEDRTRYCRRSLAGTNTSRRRPDHASLTPRRFDRQMDRCWLGLASIFRSLRRILRRRTCRRHASRLPRAGSRTSCTTPAATKEVGILTPMRSEVPACVPTILRNPSYYKNADLPPHPESLPSGTNRPQAKLPFAVDSHAHAPRTSAST